MKIKVNNKLYKKFYDFEGGTYFIPESPLTGGDAWFALLDNGKLQILFNGVHRDYDSGYEIIPENNTVAQC